jgi:predicted GIY-YIG superfamily endonuclease
VFYVYILRSISSPEEIYIGFSNNLKNRIVAHNAGQSTHTNKFKPWKLETYIAFSYETKARDFEKYLKTDSGIAFRSKRLI